MISDVKVFKVCFAARYVLSAFELRGRIGFSPTLLITDIGISLANSGMCDEFRSSVGENVSV